MPNYNINGDFKYGEIINRLLYYTAAEVATMLRQTKRDKIYTMCRSGELKAFLFGRTWLIDKEYFDKWRKAQIPS